MLDFELVDRGADVEDVLSVLALDAEVVKLVEYEVPWLVSLDGSSDVLADIVLAVSLEVGGYTMTGDITGVGLKEGLAVGIALFKADEDDMRDD